MTMIDKILPGGREYRLDKIRRQMRKASTLVEWRALAEDHDQLSGAEEWKTRSDNLLFDSTDVSARTAKLVADRDAGNVDEMLFTLNEGLHGNLGGMGSSKLYRQSKSGTKKVITDYIDAVLTSLDEIAQAPERKVSRKEKLAFFKRAAKCYGRSALLLSGGSGLIYFHHGVVEELFIDGLLPKVLSGSSAGSWVCAQLATRKDDELVDDLAHKRYSKVRPAGWREMLVGLAKLSNARDFDAMRDALIDDFIEDLTFGEAFEQTGRMVSISIAPADHHQRARVLNALTSPNITLRSAVRASSCVPGLTKPVMLEAKDSRGKPKPYLPNLRWIDGAISADLPMRRLARLYAVNHFIVSQINPESMIARYVVHDPKAAKEDPLLAASNIFFSSMREAVKLANRSFWPFRNQVTEVAEEQFERFDTQNYSGDITISHRFGQDSLRHLRFDFNGEDDIEALILEGRRATWPHIDQIRNAMVIGLKLQSLIKEMEQ